MDALRNKGNFTWAELASRLQLSVSMLTKIRLGYRQWSGRSFFRFCEMEKEFGTAEPGKIEEIVNKSPELREVVEFVNPPQAAPADELELWRGRAQRAETENARLRASLRKLLEDPFSTEEVTEGETESQKVTNTVYSLKSNPKANRAATEGLKRGVGDIQSKR